MTTLTRRDPLHVEFPEWVNRWFDDRGLTEKLFGDLPTAMPVEEFTADGSRVIRAEIPGVDPDKDVEVSVHDGMVSIIGTRTEKQEQRDDTAYRSEFRYGRFERTLPLPAGTTAEDVKATYTDGVLEVRLPMRATAQQAAKIPIQRG